MKRDALWRLQWVRMWERVGLAHVGIGDARQHWERSNAAHDRAMAVLSPLLAMAAFGDAP